MGQVEIREEGEEGSAWLVRLGAPARQNRRASLCVFSLYPLPEAVKYGVIRDEVRPCVFFLSTLYCTAIFAVLNGSPLQSDHALPSTLFSLLPTLYYS